MEEYEPGKLRSPTLPESNGTPENPIPQSALFSSRLKPKVVLNDGTVLEGASAATVDSATKLWVRIPSSSGLGLAQVLGLFSDPEKTSRIEKWFDLTKEPEIFERFTRFDSIKADDSGWIAVRMIREF